MSKNKKKMAAWLACYTLLEWKDREQPGWTSETRDYARGALPYVNPRFCAICGAVISYRQDWWMERSSATRNYLKHLLNKHSVHEIQSAVVRLAMSGVSIPDSSKDQIRYVQEKTGNVSPTEDADIYIAMIKAHNG